MQINPPDDWDVELGVPKRFGRMGWLGDNGGAVVVLPVVPVVPVVPLWV